MATTSSLAQIPLPERTDRVDGPGSFALLATKLEDITVVPYASTGTRTTAYGSRVPAKGSVSFLVDQNQFQYYTGTSWTPFLPDNYPMGIVYYTWLNTSWPLDGSYVPANTERMDDGTDLTVQLYTNRIYRISYDVAVVDGGPGTTTTSGGAEFRIRYNASPTLPTISSTLLTTGRAGIVADAALTASSGHASRVWPCPASGTYSFGVGLMVNNTAGCRLGQDRSLTVEDLGKTK